MGWGMREVRKVGFWFGGGGGWEGGWLKKKKKGKEGDIGEGKKGEERRRGGEGIGEGDKVDKGGG